MTTLRDIARATNASIDTVSRVLNGRTKRTSGASALRAQRIREAAELLGYRPNAAARSMRQGRFGAIGLLLAGDIHSSRIPYAIQASLGTTLAEASLSLLTTIMPDTAASGDGPLPALPALLAQRQVDGIVVHLSGCAVPQVAARLAQLGIPHIWINAETATDAVRPDDEGAAVELTRHLIALGHRRIAWARMGESPHYSLIHRRRGWLRAMTEAGLDPVELPQIDGLGRIEIGRRWLAEHPGLTAVVCYGNGELAPLWLAAASLGIDVPAQLSLATFGDIESTIHSGLHPTRMELPHRELGRLAAERIIARCAGAPSEPTRAVPFALRNGQTTAPPPAP